MVLYLWYFIPFLGEYKYLCGKKTRNLSSAVNPGQGWVNTASTSRWKQLAVDDLVPPSGIIGAQPDRHAFSLPWHASHDRLIEA
jgi:hypothetical protein